MCYPWTPKWSLSQGQAFSASILQLHLWLGLGAQLAGPLLLSVCSGDPVGVNPGWVWSPASHGPSAEHGDS